jgi:2-polyprenyl-3-methyl-5-hydroxy-6-metoxy-1,4-benzoquinol methylase
MRDADAAIDDARARRYWDSHVEAYDRSLVVLGRLARLSELVREEIAGRERVLEVGAGTGAITITLASAVREVTATDYSTKMVETLRARLDQKGIGNVRCEVRAIAELGDEQSFDGVVCANVLHLVANVDESIAVLKRALKPGGVLLVPTFCHGQTLLSRSVSRALRATGFPVRHRLTAATLELAVKRAGLLVHRTELLGGLIPIAFVAARRA